MPDTYTPPLDDINFVLRHITDLEALSKLNGFEHADVETLGAALEEAGRFMAEVVAPTNRIGDQVGSIHDGDASVTTPDGLKDAYEKFVASGWGAVAYPAEAGGAGLPWLIGLAVQEMFTSANMAFSIGPMLTQGTVEALLFHGADEHKATFLDKLVSGEWMGTMVLTEPEAGSDVGALRSKAVPNGDGTYAITGTKIFISWGEHDLSENIIHMVLARTPEAPPGTRGISMFIVPKFLVNPDGSLGERNSFKAVSIEHKMGIHASPTCVMDFDGATGYLVGEENHGMRYMFTMMNSARLSVGVEGLAVSERAYQMAVAYAQERLQGRAIGAPKTEHSPIIDHPDVRRMLMTIKAYNEAMRCLLYANAEAFDRSHHASDEAARTAASERLDLLTPISKAWCTDLGVELTSLALQVFGGMGYVEETGVAQHYRDARIAPIYEGTNGIQAIDLVARKLPMRNGGAVEDLIKEMSGLDAELAEAGEALATIRSGLSDAVADLTSAVLWLAAHGMKDPNNALAGATPFLRLMGTTLGGYFMARSALAAREQLAKAEGDAAFLEAKIATARFYAEQLLPQTKGLLPMVTAGAEQLFQIPVDRL
ncbi:MAG: acyl-CoA dehydrogenase [Acidimicrobiia bacterium]|nr:acyl-CoA dehydrogenase C-terminal domain-containing protein [Acidimicrobiia bacterium]MBT8217713.1 acyl-CoA dehydrogenase C-terminal domain-containing protein [Acidimicrobiia bacterium]NNF11565.1 acyl-CoA dehydrogenase [Acidimicrobiia bacterium]NNL70446.1 acyl-CoA dehydrogenase [Acidimicrobiia bacterium]